LLHILMNHLLAKASSDILPSGSDSNTNTTQEGDAVVVVGNKNSANEGSNVFGDVLATLERQERPKNHAAESVTRAHAFEEDTDTSAISSEKDTLDIENTKVARSSTELADMPESRKAEEISQNKFQPIELKSDSVFRETETRAETLPKPELPLLKSDVQEGSSALYEPYEIRAAKHAANSTQHPPKSAVFKSHSLQTESNPLPPKISTLAVENVAGEREEGVQTREKTTSLHEVKAKRSPGIIFQNNVPSGARDDALAKFVAGAAPHHEIALKPAGSINHVSQSGQMFEQLQIPSKERNTPASAKAPDKVEAQLVAYGSPRNPPPQQDIPEFPRPAVPTQGSVLTKPAQPELLASAPEVSKAPPIRASLEAPHRRQAFSSDVQAPTAAANPDKPLVSLPPVSLANQTSEQHPKALADLEVAPNTSSVFTSQGAMEITQPSKQVSPTLLQLPDLPRHVAQQMATAVRSAAENSVEITLKPAELGRVHISMSTSEAGVVMHVTAERPETLELMRRHIDQLANEFQDIGYGQSEFRFDGAGSDESQARDDQTNDQSRETSDPGGLTKQTASDASHVAMPNRIDLDRVDIRI